MCNGVASRLHDPVESLLTLQRLNMDTNQFTVFMSNSVASRSTAPSLWKRCSFCECLGMDNQFIMLINNVVNQLEGSTFALALSTLHALQGQTYRSLSLANESRAHLDPAVFVDLSMAFCERMELNVAQLTTPKQGGGITLGQSWLHRRADRCSGPVGTSARTSS